MSFPLTMSGHERTYRPPRSLRGNLGSEVTAWDMFRLERSDVVGDWAKATLDSIVASVDAEAQDALGCIECLDTGFYGVVSSTDPDLLIGLHRRQGDGDYETLLADGTWMTVEVHTALEVLDSDTALDLAGAITAGASGLLRLYGQPKAFLPPADVVEPVISADVIGAPQETLDDWAHYAVVVDEDPGAVIDLLRTRNLDVERWEPDGWVPEAMVGSDVPLVRLTDRQREDVTLQMQSLTADAPPTVSPDPRAEKLRRYWSSGKGAAKIRWLTPGDWKRCYRKLFKYMGPRAAGYCQNLHKRNTGVWTGSRFNVGGNGRGGLLSSAAPESLLYAALQSGRVTGDTERNGAMPTTLLTDGVYSELDDSEDKLLQNIAASAIPVNPPDEWFDNPNLTKPTTLTVTEDGRVFGHLAPWGVTHIGMAGSVPAPKSRDGRYGHFRTGQLVTASGKNVRVGQLTLVGGHASRTASAADAVKHYDDTQSGVADIAVGEDQHGIWAAGALRPGVTPEQIRVMRACPPSGDWRRINGNLELVAACHVNVQGFPIAEAMVAGGAITALVAAGARQMAELRMSELGDQALLARLDRLEQLVAAAAPATLEVAKDPEADPGEDNPAAAETTDVEVPDADDDPDEADVELTPEQQATADKIAKAREEIAAARRQAMRDKIGTTAAGVPPQFAGKSTVKGKGSFPIGNVGDLRKAIQAFGRAGDKPAAKAHIISMAKKLGRPDLIPSNWKAGK